MQLFSLHTYDGGCGGRQGNNSLAWDDLRHVVYIDCFPSFFIYLFIFGHSYELMALSFVVSFKL